MRAVEAIKTILGESVPEIDVGDVEITIGYDKGQLKIVYNMDGELKNYTVSLTPDMYADLNVSCDMLSVAIVCVRFVRGLLKDSLKEIKS